MNKKSFVFIDTGEETFRAEFTRTRAKRLIQFISLYKLKGKLDEKILFKEKGK